MHSRGASDGGDDMHSNSGANNGASPNRLAKL